MLGPVQNYEDVTIYPLDDDKEQLLLATQNECTFIWSNKDGWPVGVIMSYVFQDAKFWLTASAQRLRISAVRRDPRVCICVTSKGTTLGANSTVTYKGTCELSQDDATKAWFYPALAKLLRPDDKTAQKNFVAFLDSPNRIILSVTPTQRIGYDGAKMGRATKAWLSSRPAATPSVPTECDNGMRGALGNSAPGQ